MLRRLGQLPELALLAVARATLVRPADSVTLAAIDEAREIFTRIGAFPLLKLLDDAVAGSAAEAGSAAATGSAAAGQVSLGARQTAGTRDRRGSN